MTNVANIRPRADLVLIRRLPAMTEETAGGIQLPEDVARAFFRAEVLAVGDGLWDAGHKVPIGLNPGDIVLVAEDQKDKQTGQVFRQHLLPVTPDGGVYLVKENIIAGVEITGG